MLEIKNLTKIYRSQNRKKTKALDDVSLTLPDHGLVFIIGKSGSGKSTLLNLIGGLDKITSGDIIFNNLRVSKLSRAAFENYRSKEIGFIFQHYFLLDILNVRNNIKLSQDVCNNYPYDAKELLEMVDLAGYEKRYPYELSGGQKQRVAVARAIAKDPHIILGDEPTGNLDSKTALAIMQILKEISKKKLVIIVSHNLIEAQMFADRIIELNSGKIISDKVRTKANVDEFYREDKKLFLPYYRDLTHDEVVMLNYLLEKKMVTEIIQQDDGFTPFVAVEKHANDLVISKVKMLPKRRRKYRRSFLKKLRKTRIANIIITTLLLVAISLVGSILNESYMELDYDENQEHVILSNNPLYDEDDTTMFSTYINQVTEKEIAMIEEVYDGKIYKLYSESLYSVGAKGGIRSYKTSSVLDNTAQFYLSENFGVLNCDLAFIQHYVASNQEITLLAGAITENSRDLIIPDYLADSILYYFPSAFQSYDDILSKQIPNSNSKHNHYISAIIKTDYLAKYGNLKALFDEALENDSIALLSSKLKKENNYQAFLTDILYYYGIAYNVSPNYVEGFSNRGQNYISLQRFTVEYESKKEVWSNWKDPANISKDTSNQLEAGEMIMSIYVYNTLFGTSYSADNLDIFKSHKITFSYYDNNEAEDVIYQKEFVIKRLDAEKTIVDEIDYSELNQFKFFPYAVYLENNMDMDNVIQALKGRNFNYLGIDMSNMIGLTKILKIFEPFFVLIQYSLYVFLLVYVLVMGYNSVKKNYYEIGVMSALGMKIKDVTKIITPNILITCAFVCILSTGFYPPLILLINRILITALENILDLTFYFENIIKIDVRILYETVAIVILVALISLLTSIIMLKRLKPIEIINEEHKGV